MLSVSLDGLSMIFRIKDVLNDVILGGITESCDHIILYFLKYHFLVPLSLQSIFNKVYIRNGLGLFHFIFKSSIYRVDTYDFMM